MNEQRRKKRRREVHRRLSLRGPVTLFIVVLVLIVTLTILWNVVLVNDYQKLKALTTQDSAFHWTFIALGSALFVTIIILSSLLGAQLIAQIRWSQRQSNFIASVSHELNSPLSSIKLFAQTLRQKELAFGDRLNFAEKILFDVERLQRLIANILRAAEVDNRGGELQVVLQRVELRAYLLDYLEDVRRLREASGLQIEFEGDGDSWVELDKMMFRQVLDNLVDNAIHYRGAKAPRIDLNLSQLDRRVRLAIRDHGAGIPRAELGKVFDRFYRVEAMPAKHQRKGTGIGLYVVRSIVEAHGGEVEATSEGPGEGTVIRIDLPLLSL